MWWHGPCSRQVGWWKDLLSLHQASPIVAQQSSVISDRDNYILFNSELHEKAGKSAWRNIVSWRAEEYVFGSSGNFEQTGTLQGDKREKPRKKRFAIHEHEGSIKKKTIRASWDLKKHKFEVFFFFWSEFRLQGLIKFGIMNRMSFNFII